MTSLYTLTPGFAGEPTAAQLWLARAARRTVRSAGKIGALVAATGAALGVAILMVPAPVPAAPPGAAESWIDINRPIQLFSLVGTEFARLPLAYAARRDVGGGGRRDLLVFGSPKGDTPYLQLSFRRSGRSPEPVPTLLADLDRIDPDGRTGITHAGMPSTIETRFGPFETADLRLVTDRRSSPCIGFRSKPLDADVLRIAGLVCGTSDRPAGRDLLGCVIDRIDLVSAGSDDALRGLFVDAERRRGSGCAPAPIVSARHRPHHLARRQRVCPTAQGSVGREPAALRRLRPIGVRTKARYRLTVRTRAWQGGL